MSLEIRKDGYGQPYIQWKQGDREKRAWVQERTGETDWAGTRRYLNVAPCYKGNPSGTGPDYPIYNDLSNEQILMAFFHSVNAITGCEGLES